MPSPARASRWAACAAAVCLATSGCGAAGGARTAPLTAAPDRSVVGQEELSRSRAATLLDVLLQVRPDFAHAVGSRHVYSAVYVDGVRMGEAWALQSIRPDLVQQVRFVRGADSPSRAGEGAVLVTMRSRDP